MLKENADDSTVLSIFNFSARLARHIPDHARLGAYSQDASAKMYWRAAATMPRLLLMLCFADVPLAKTMQDFLEHLDKAEEEIKSVDLQMMHKIDPKDRGPFLYWLVKEWSPSHSLALLGHMPLLRSCSVRV